MRVLANLEPSKVDTLSSEFENASATEVLRWAYDQFGSAAAIGTSFQGAGIVAIHHAVAAGLPLAVFTIDTGLLFPETIELKSRLEHYFGIMIESLTPEYTVEQQGEQVGPKLWRGTRIFAALFARLSRCKRNWAHWMPGLRGYAGNNLPGDHGSRFWSFMNSIGYGRKIS